jgi:hypothetical protein
VNTAKSAADNFIPIIVASGISAVALYLFSVIAGIGIRLGSCKRHDREPDMIADVVIDGEATTVGMPVDPDQDPYVIKSEDCI